MNKIKRLIKEWRRGTIKLSSHLQSNGYQRELIKKYKNSNWLESLGYGAYKLSGDEVGWYSGIEALQKQKLSNIHPGSKSALELKGYGHYLRQNGQTIKLFGSYKESLPAWFNNQEWSRSIKYTQTKLFNYEDEGLYTNIKIEGIELKISIPELAVLEMLFEIPKGQTFDEALKIMENLMTLRPNKVQYLLQNCNSVKVKRIFMWMAEKVNHTWAKELDLTRIDFGKGERMVVRNGTFDKKYRITVPRDYEG
ncbi:MAG: hypothetical protein SCALA702_33040 [Melioribacteraceae bacterium]|nr:MAG: hypothetical protein SCALA702_33040 [Melioribacteraceae bacterium]